MRDFFVFFVAAALLLGCATGEPPAKRLAEGVTGLSRPPSPAARRQLVETSDVDHRCALVRQTSFAPCQLGRNFGCDPASGSMWVASCRGKFRCSSSVVRCGYPPGKLAYNCSCSGEARGMIRAGADRKVHASSRQVQVERVSQPRRTRGAFFRLGAVPERSPYHYFTRCADSMSRNVTRPPALLLFLHIEKAGGNSVTSWATKLVTEQVLDAVIPMNVARCWLYGAFGGLLRVHNAPGCPADMAGLERFCAWRARPCCQIPNWQTSRIAVEFHESSRPLFIARVLPNMERLRAAYSAMGGAPPLTAALVRAPVQHLFSAYKYYYSPAVEPFPQWLTRAVGLQAGLLALRPGSTTHTVTHYSSLSPTATGMENRQGCSVLPAASKVLEAIDLVAPTDCMGELLTTVVRRLRLSSWHGGSAAVPVPHKTPRGLYSHRVRNVSWQALNDSTREHVLRVADCDRTLYVEALRRARAELDGKCRAVAALKSKRAF